MYVDPLNRLLYQAALNPSDLPVALENIAEQIGADGFIWVNLESGFDTSNRTRVISRLMSDRFRNVAFPDIDDIDNFSDPRVKLLLASQNSLINVECARGHEFAKDHYHKTFLEERLKTRYTLGIHIVTPLSRVSRNRPVAPGFNRLTSRGSFDDAAIKRAAEITKKFPHFLEMRDELRPIAIASAMGVAGLNSIPQAVFALRSDLVVTWLNTAAQKLTEASVILRLSRQDRKLLFAPPFHDRIIQAVRVAKETGNIVKLFTDVVRLDHSKWVISVIPTRPELASLGIEGDNTVLIVVNKISAISADFGAKLREFFDLTPAECLLALSLAAGRSVHEYSLDRNVKISTARYHVRALLEKTHSRDLMALSLLLGQLSSAV